VVVRRTQLLQAEVTQHHTKFAEHTSDALANVPVIQSFTRVEAELRELRSIGQRLLEAQIPVLSWWALAAVATRAAATLTVTAVLLLGSWLIAQGSASVGELVTFMSLATMLISRLDSTVGFVSTLFIEAPKMRELFTLLDTTPSVRDRPGAREVSRLTGAMTFEDVHFSYDGQRTILDGLSFEVSPGETVALVGTSGSGKTTTLSLLYRAFDPSAGRITADGLDLPSYTLHSLRKNIAVVFQEPMLFARSIRENLLVGKPDATDAEIRLALERAQAWELVEQQSQGLDTILGERGRSLSGGERQRLSIARALLKNPPILILDEATAALDAETERKVKLALDEVMRQRTTFVIAHRLATVRDASRILVFERGRVIESGSFAELVERGGRFAALVRAQVLDTKQASQDGDAVEASSH
jgi:glucan exporter ATP-binding protein